ncbi:MAG: helix-turn-helix domain-containing protein [Acidobacteriota bacterium]
MAATHRDRALRDAARVGEILRYHREAMGWSKARLAAETGLDRAILRASETGQDPRASTLESLLLALPALCPGDLFPGVEVRPPLASEGPWRQLDDPCGLEADVIEREIAWDDAGQLTCRTELRGLRQAGAGLADPELRPRLMRVASQASGPLLRRIAASHAEWTRGPLDLSLDDAEHHFSITGRGASARLSYRTAWCAPRPSAWSDKLAMPLASGCHLSVHLPVRELVLRLRGPGLSSLESRLVTWPHALVPWRSEDDLSACTHPDEAGIERRRAEDSLEVSVARPALGLDHGLAARHETAPAGGSPPISERVTERLHQVRERSGHSVRSLGAAMGVSAMTVHRTEAGGDPRRSTLEAYLRALPELSPWELLAVSSRREVSRHAAWSYYRDLCRCEADEQVKRVTIARTGNSRISIETVGFRWLGPTGHDLKLRLGLGRHALQATPAELRSIGSSRRRESFRIGRVPGLHGRPERLLRVPAALVEKPLTYARRLQHRNVYVLSAARARELTGGTGPFREGQSFGPLLPSRTLRLVVRFPKGYVPREPMGHAWLTPDTPDSNRPGFETLLHPEGLEPRWDGRELSLHVERSMPGVKLGLSWELPDWRG